MAILFPGYVSLQFNSRSSIKCDVLTPVKPTSAHVVSSLDAECSNEYTPMGPVVTSANHWVMMAPALPHWSLSRIEPVV